MLKCVNYEKLNCNYISIQHQNNLLNKPQIFLEVRTGRDLSVLLKKFRDAPI